MKPKPLNFDEIRQIIEDEISISAVIEKIKQHIKSACEFYLRYENDHKLLVKEHYNLLKKIEDDDIWAFTLLLTAPDLEIKIDEYNKWLFKLAFRDVLKEEKKK